jgi:thiol-disulfide isomerase/thioredoxin
VSGSRRTPRLPGAIRALLVAIVLLGSAAVGYLAHRLTAPPGTLTPLPARSPTPEGDADRASAASDEPPAPSRKVPEDLPAITLPAMDGRLKQLTDWKGKPLLINFWATWCEPCRREIPLLVALRHEHAAEHLEVIGIAIDSPDAVHKYATERRIDYPLLIGEQGGLAAASAFGMDTVLPFSVFADGSGRIVTLKVGELHRDEAELILNRVHQLDSGGLTLAQARAQISEGMERLGPRAPPGSAGSPQ